MAKVTWFNYKPRPNVLKELFRSAQAAQGLTSDQLGKKLGLSGAGVRSVYHRGKWDSEDINKWCKALNITDPTEVGKAILY